MYKEKFIRLIKDKGVVGGGGGGFPTYAKFSFDNLTTLIINGAECEPLLYSDYFLFSKRNEEIVVVLDKIQEIFNFEEIYIVLKEKRRDLIQYLQKAGIKGIKNLHFYLMRDVYPAGDEQIIIKSIKGLTLPPFTPPGEKGFVVINTQTLLYIYEAIIKNQPTMRRFITVSGYVKTPLVVDVPIGTKVKDLIQLTGGYTTKKPVIFAGGLLMGNLVGESYSIKKTTTGIVVIPENSKVLFEKKHTADFFSKLSKSVCDQCMECTFFCSRNIIGKKLSPHLIMRNSSKLLSGKLEIPTEILNCSECGLCYVYSCPLGLSPRKVIRSLKKKVKRRNLKNCETQISEPLIYLPTSEKIKKRLEIDLIDRIPEFYGVYTPQRVSMDLNQGKGKSPKIFIKEGDFVFEGEKIGEVSEEDLGTPIHSPINGMVFSISENKIHIERDTF